MDTTKKTFFIYLTIFHIFISWFFINLSTPIAISFMSDNHQAVIIEENGKSHVVFHHGNYKNINLKEHSSFEKKYISVLYNPSFNHPDHEFHVSLADNVNQEKDNLISNISDNISSITTIVFSHKPIEFNKFTKYDEKPDKETDTKQTISNTILTI